MKTMNTITKILLSTDVFNSLKFLVGINYPVDTITLEKTALTPCIREFFGDELDNINTDYVMCIRNWGLKWRD